MILDSVLSTGAEQDMSRGGRVEYIILFYFLSVRLSFFSSRSTSALEQRTQLKIRVLSMFLLVYILFHRNVRDYSGEGVRGTRKVKKHNFMM
jgi:hypothetical protein